MNGLQGPLATLQPTRPSGRLDLARPGADSLRSRKLSQARRPLRPAAGCAFRAGKLAPLRPVCIIARSFELPSPLRVVAMVKLATFALFAILAGVCHAAPPGSFAWRRARPEEVGMSARPLQRMADALMAHRTEQLLVIRHGRIVLERYAEGFNLHRPHYTASLAKAIVGGVALAILIGEKAISPDDLACDYIPAWREDKLRCLITIRHLATHSSGIEDAREGDIPHSRLPGWKGEFWRRRKSPFDIALFEAPVLFRPGTGFEYSNPGIAALDVCMAEAARRAGLPDLRGLLAKRVMQPLGVADGEWSMSYGRSWRVGDALVHATWGGGAYSPDAVARIGLMMLGRGSFAGRQLIPSAAIEATIADAGMPTPSRLEDMRPRSGLCWWLNTDGVFPRVPPDAFFGAGAGHQILAVIPSLDLVVVRLGQKMGEPYWTAVCQFLLSPLMDAFSEDQLQRAHDAAREALARRPPPQPHSQVVGRVRYAPRSQIIRRAAGSDNWPMTWGDDDAIYAAYGDGWGFEPRRPKKLSLGFARILGAPPNFRGVNIPSPSGELTGDGPAGGKASGMLMVGGVLYMWVRNMGNAQLAWSTDHAQTWQWGFKFTESFGHPVFLNFGPNYDGARDNYVYVYTPDGPSAYESYDQVILARVPKNRIRDQSAYEFFAGVDRRGQPVWTHDFSRRAGVLVYTGRCARLDVAYNPGLGRYLMALGFNHSGAWGLFEAPEPWGPWSICFWTDRWDCGDTHSYRLPTKWFSRDGRLIYLVFSGRRFRGVDYDALCVRAARLDPPQQ